MANFFWATAERSGTQILVNTDQIEYLKTTKIMTSEYTEIMFDNASVVVKENILQIAKWIESTNFSKGIT